MQLGIEDEERNTAEMVTMEMAYKDSFYGIRIDIEFVSSVQKCGAAVEQNIVTVAFHQYGGLEPAAMCK